MIDDLSVGGAQVHLVRLADGLRQRGHDVEILALGRTSPLVVGGLSDAGIVRRFEMSSVWRPGFWREFLRLTKHLRRNRPSIVHAYLNTAGVFGPIAARAAGIRHVATSRRDMGSFRSGTVRKLERVVSRTLAARVFCVCQAVATEAHREEQIPLSRIRVVLNGVETSRRQQRSYRSAAPLSFGMVASMDRPAKGHRDLLLATSWIAARTGSRVPVTLVGDGSLRSGLEELAASTGLTASVRFLGARADVNDVLDSIDVVIVPSHTEGISNAALEAMAAGLPVVATAVDGNLETVVPGETGLLVQPRSPEALGQAMLSYWNDPGLAARHGRAGRLRAEHVFGIDRMIDEFEREYTEMSVA